MISNILVVGKRRGQEHIFIVNPADWLNEKIYLMDGQDPYTNDTTPILKEDYKYGWYLDENQEPKYT